MQRKSIRILICLILSVVIIFSSISVILTNSISKGHININVEESLLEVSKKVWDGYKWVEEITTNTSTNVRFNITITYFGNRTLLDIKVKDTLPVGIIYANNATPTESGISGNIIYWNLTDNLLDGDSVSIEFDAFIEPQHISISELRLENLANVSALECGVGPMYGEDTATVIIKKTDKFCDKKVWDSDTSRWVNGITADVGDTVRFNITITYWGNDSLLDIKVVDTLPPCLEYANNADPTESGISGNKIYWNLTNVLYDSESVSIEFDTLVISDGININLANITGSECGGGEMSCSDTATVYVNESFRICEKEVWDSDTSRWVNEITADVGDIVRFNITITYWGNYSLYNIRVIDTLPPCLEYANNADPTESGISGNKIYWNITDVFLLNGESVSIEFDTLVISDGININHANITANECSGEIWRCYDTATVYVNKTSKICEKQVWDSKNNSWTEEIYADIGDTVRFKITISYWGDYTLSNIKVVDTLPSCLEYANNADPTESGISGNKIYWNLTNMLSDGSSVSIEFDTLVISDGVNINQADISAKECSGEILYCTDIAIVNVTDNIEELVVNAGGPYFGLVDKSIQFTGSVTGGVSPYSYNWDFDDGHTSNNKNPTHFYTQPGVYTATFTVVDDIGLVDSDDTTVTITEDTTKPIIQITQPLENYLYFRENTRELKILKTTIIIGSIDIKATASDSGSGISHVEFYIDDILKDSLNSAPYKWTWDEISFGKHTIKVIAYDNSENSDFDEIMVWKFL